MDLLQLLRWRKLCSCRHTMNSSATVGVPVVSFALCDPIIARSLVRVGELWVRTRCPVFWCLYDVVVVVHPNTAGVVQSVQQAVFTWRLGASTSTIPVCTNATSNECQPKNGNHGKSKTSHTILFMNYGAKLKIETYTVKPRWQLGIYDKNGASG